MGSYRSLIWQCAAFVAVTCLFALFVPEGAEGARVCVLGAGLVLTCLFAGISLYRRHRVMALSDRIDAVLHGGRTVDFKSCREGDIAILQNELEKMVARLARSQAQLEQERNALADSLADISHQIRTPLTAAELMLTVIERTDDERERRAKTHELEGMLDRMAWLVTTLLKIARIDAGSLSVDCAHVNVEDVVVQAVAPLETSFDLRGVELAVAVEPGSGFIGDGRWTAEAVENIVKNCLEHTPQGGTVTIEAAENALGTTIEVWDTGPGIAEADLPHIFERFYRGHECAPQAEVEGGTDAGYAPGGSVSMRAPSGFGVGLALARSLVTLQGGTLRAANREGAGASFTLFFPKVTV